MQKQAASNFFRAHVEPTESQIASRLRAQVPTTSPRTGRKEFISTEIAEQIMGHLASQDMQLLFALARWGGMRMPSEPANLKWTDIDFEHRRINFRSPKTEHHEGKRPPRNPFVSRSYRDHCRTHSRERRMGPVYVVAVSPWCHRRSIAKALNDSDCQAASEALEQTLEYAASNTSHGVARALPLACCGRVARAR